MANDSSAFQAEGKNLEHLMRDGAYSIPLYQRPYVWKTEQNSRLWEDVCGCFESGTNHFLGSLVLMNYKRDKTSQPGQADELNDRAVKVYSVVDGQQRLMSITLMLAAVCADMYKYEDMFKNLPDVDQQNLEDWDVIKVEMMNCLVVREDRDYHSKTGKGHIPRVIPGRTSYEAYKSAMNRETDGIGKRSRTSRAYRYYENEVRKLRECALPITKESQPNRVGASAAEFLGFYQRLYVAIARRMIFVRIVCAEEEDPFQVFESLNGTGLDLTSSDRIKNQLMGKGSTENPPFTMSNVSSEWENLREKVRGQTKRRDEPSRESDLDKFFGVLLFVKRHERVSRKDLPKEFAHAYFDRGWDVRRTFRDLLASADNYRAIVRQEPIELSSGKMWKPGEDLAEVLNGIQSNNPKQSLVPLMAAADAVGIESREFDQIANVLLVMLVRHKVCERPENELDKAFGEFCERISEDTVDSAISLLKTHTVGDEAFRRAFSELEFDPDKSSEMDRARYYLTSIENYLRRQDDGNDRLNTGETLPVEHIIPQDFIPEDWFEGYPEEAARFKGESGEDDEEYRQEFLTSTIQGIGNLCLLRKAENSKASNKNFKKKLEVYRTPAKTGESPRGTFKLVDQIVENKMVIDGQERVIVEEGKTFSTDAVQRRAEVLADYALKIWKN
ncbi:MAG: DUF262 domain-containing protein [Tractidigestivibacter sp.]|jgi:hypothetical protein|uniref:DUF262 domain-containing protein n=1 Tax=Tractidigestivibacter sp. TaxID=2847320 RepID=UPI003D8FE552